MSDHSEKRLIAFCAHCEDKHECHIDGEYIGYDQDETPYIYLLVHCSNCCGVLLLVQEPDPVEGMTPPVRLHPPPRTRLGPHIPTKIKDFHSEAVACFEIAKAYTATALMCRRVIEQIAAEQGAKGRTLAAKLSFLADTGHLDRQISEWISELRGLGNEAAHATSIVVSRDDAEDALALTEAAMTYVYTYRVQFENYRNRRSSRGDFD